MAIATVNQLIAGQLAPVAWHKAAGTGEAVGELWSPMWTAGMPGAMTAPASSLNGATLSSSTAGSIAIPSAVTGDYIELSEFAGQHAGGVGGVWLVDLLWANVPVPTTTTSQAITHPGLPSRDRSASSAGDGVHLALVVSTATSNGSAITNTTASYTDSDGNAGATATITSFPATAVAGTWARFNLAAGDKGCRSVESVTLGTSYGTGVIHLYQYRPIAFLALTAAGIAAQALPPGVLRRVWDSSCLALVYETTSTTIGATSGLLGYAQG